MSSITVNQVTEITAENTFRVLETVTASTDIDDAVFVNRVSDQAFDHYATVTDLVNYPDTRETALADGLGYYRTTVSDRHWDDIDTALAQKQMTRDRLALLVTQWDTYSAGFAEDVTVVITS